MLNSIVSNTKTPWKCFRDPNSNLVYFKHSKCACTYYELLFVRLNWTLCTTTDIDWENDYVFSYIRDPLYKHRTGIVEWFYYNRTNKLLTQNIDDDTFFQLLSEIVYIDHHSMSIYEHLGYKANLVHWIPIDLPNVDHRQETFDLIKLDHATKTWFLTIPPANVSSGFKKDCVNRLMSYKPTPLVIKSLEYDQCIYDRVTIQNFEPATYKMRIKQLLDQGLTQDDAEKIADNEVATGKFQNWTHNGI